MRFGVRVMANIDEIGFFNHAEALGYDSVWVTDSQMLFSDCCAVLALASRQTTRLRLGPGTAIANAVADALRPLGVEITEMPLTRERLRRRLHPAETHAH
jgi:hypothetical protein